MATDVNRVGFRIHESEGGIQADVVEALLADELAFCVFRGAVEGTACRTLSESFRAAPQVRRRGDQVPGRTLGTIHFLKDAPDYLADSARAAVELEAFFAGRPNPLAAALQRIGVHLAARGVGLRAGRHGDQTFCPMVLRSWEGTGDYSLLPHEDMAQLGHAPQAGLEFARATPTVGNINICLANFADPEHGAVRLWNLAPDAAERARLGIGSSGYPYPAAALRGRDSVQVPIFPGDVYLINGKYVHAVTGGPVGGHRVTLATMLAFVDDAQCIHWT